MVHNIKIQQLVWFIMESAAGLAMETSKVKSGVRNQAEDKLNQLEHSESAGLMRRPAASAKEKDESAGTGIAKTAGEIDRKRRYSADALCDEENQQVLLSRETSSRKEFSRSANQLKTLISSEAVDDLRRVIRAGCQLLSSIEMAKTTRSLQKKRTQVLFPVGTLEDTFEREEFCVQRIQFNGGLYIREAPLKKHRLRKRAEMKKAAGALCLDDVISSDITISMKLMSTSRCYLELAIAKRCRSDKLERQRFAFALKIQQMLFATRKTSRFFSQEKPAGSNSTPKRELQ
ncbi:paired amphipathic helix protein Sin3-like 2 [Dorcoceras hygrometricum]|uniref:Paired amphipathic helix protein Sin3-like 2 n=1 Tax=Dorcoceras hygrometricum TaxID=472368 RepID=A0A2Z7CTB8_9LAMI|nr:paired amphipathic helix protein Sin3-like 2 [Dorcoceras hygrometricum]